MASHRAPDSGATFEPAIEYVGNRTIVAVLRHASGNRYTFQSISTDMGRSFSKPVEIDRDADGTADARSRWFEIYDGRFSFSPTDLQATRWRFQLQLQSNRSAGSPRIRRVRLTPDTQPCGS